MQDWTQILRKELNEGKTNHIEFVNKHYDIIGGLTRDAKIKRVKRLIEKIKNESNTENQNVKESVYENNQPKILELNAQSDHKAKRISFGLMGDTQFGSKYAQLTYLHKYYDLCADLGIKDVYHTGDISDGEKMRPDHTYENYVQGASEHINEIVTNYPKRNGINTHFITGNHDASFRKLCGLDIGEQIDSKRDDMHYLGRDIAKVNITPNISMILRHPWDGTAYALSYKIQKMVESMDENMRPTIMAVGHYHKLEYLYYLGVHCFQTGCFQSSTPFTVGKGIRVSMGGWIVTLDLDSEGNLISITPKAVTYQTSIKDDYKNFKR